MTSAEALTSMAARRPHHLLFQLSFERIHPLLRLGAAGSKDGIGHCPQMLKGVEDFHYLHHLDLPYPHELPGIAPDPLGSIPQHHYQDHGQAAKPPPAGFGIQPIPETLGLLFRFRHVSDPFGDPPQ